ncbi:MAG: hypothetical protein HY047_18620 [Acidobacteria bacterium]|nr:hypothetical protein [Acidobacteriota bacterium]
MDPATPPATAHVFSDLVRRVQSEFLEMPGLRLTEAQVRRLSGLDPSYCSAVLSALVDAGFLMRTKDGFFMRIDRALPVKTERPQPPAARTKPAA